MAENLAQSRSADAAAGSRRGDPSVAHSDHGRGGRPRVLIPYHDFFNRSLRLVGMACLLGSALGLLAAAAGMPLNLLSMLAALLLSLGLIGYTVRPSLRRPRF